MMHIEKNRVVSIRYVMKNSRQEILEDTMQNMPVSYLHGSAGIQQVLQVQLDGLKAGDSKTVYLKTETGLTTEDFTFDVKVDVVRLASEAEIMLGYPVEANAQKCEDDCDCYNEIE